MRTLARSLAALVLALVAGVWATAPAVAHDVDTDRLLEDRQQADTGLAAPLSSSNVALLSANPSQAGISGCFSKTDELFVTSGLESLRVYDVSDGAHPQLTGVLDSAVFENEAMNCGERRQGGETRRFALIGVDLYQASTDDIQHTSVGGGELVVVDVTDPANPFIRSRAPGLTSTHTVACVDEYDCRYAYSAGDSGSGTFSIFDLTDLDNPHEVDADPTVEGVQAFSSPTAGHKWNFDGAGIGTHTGFDGSSMWDLTDPRDPQLLTTTGAAGRGTDPAYEGYNDFIHHNSFRPNAEAFRSDAPPSLENGNVLLVTEEDYMETDCSAAGSFQTWWVKRLDGTEDAIVPLDKVELADLGNYPVPQGVFCSAHWFDYHDSGIVAAGFYGGGSQFIDVRDPRNIKSHGHAIWGASQVWDQMWLPVYNKQGQQTGKQTNIAYSIDLVRGLDVYEVSLPGGRSTRSSSPEASSVVAPLGLVAGAGVVSLALLRRRRTT